MSSPRHVLEIILSRVFKHIFGSSTGPKVDVFEILKRKWESLNLQNETNHLRIGQNIEKEDALFAKISVKEIYSTCHYLTLG